MRVIQKILCCIGALVGLLLLLVLICYLNPQASQSLGDIVKQMVPESTVENENEPIRASNQTSQIQPLTLSSDETGEDTDLQKGLLPITAEDSYVVPAEEEISVPSQVASLVGLEPIVGTGEAIPPAQVQEIEETLSVGETGDGLTFSEEMYPYYAMLDENSKTLYRQLYANMEALIEQFKPVVATDAATLKNVFFAVCGDQPQLFWINTAYGYKYGNDGAIAEINLVFNSLASQLDTAKEEFASAANSILQGAEGLNSDYDKEVYLHDALMNRITYVLNAPMNQSAYSALVSGRTVCAGYARAFQYLCMELDIPCYYCAGYAGENHAWNIIKLEDDFYNVDVTWDDTEPNTHDYFNCTDTEYAGDHIRKELSIYLPPCNGEKYGDLIFDIPADTPEEVVEEPQESQEESSEEQETETVQSEETPETEEEETEEDYSDVDLAQVVTSVEDYYTLCKANLAATDEDTLKFDIVVRNRALWEDIYLAYRNGAHEQAYVNKELADREKGSCTVDINAVRQDGGNYKLSHTITFKD